MVGWEDLPADVFRWVAPLAVLAFGWFAGYVVGRVNKRLLTAANVPAAVEGTTFERTVRSLGTSTVSLFARLSSWFIYGVAVVIALHVARLLPADVFIIRATTFIPDLFIAIVVLAVGFVVADKAELVVSEQLRGVKVPEIGVLPRLVKYSVVYVAALVALGQVGVDIGALLVMLGMYALALIFFTGLALRDVLSASAAGVYLLLNQPYSIGDTVEVGDRRGVVQEVDVFVTRLEDDDREYIVPNHLVLKEGAIRVR
jgi:small-conductance mechanosensitive channel